MLCNANRMERAMNVTAILFEGFETLDMFGPVEMLGASGKFDVRFFSPQGGIVRSYQGAPVQTEPLDDACEPEVLLLPGGMGVYAMLEDASFIARLAELAKQARYVLSVCNGAFLYAKAGVLDGRRATTYKARMDKAEDMFPQVKWEHTARWTVEDNLYVSSGVSAGIDMTLGFIADVFGRDCADSTARYAEYTWNPNPGNDPFACESPSKIAALRSGGQSGADRGAMDAALSCGIPAVGWCPAGGWAEDYPDTPGVLALYPDMIETPSSEPIQRTEWNIRDSSCCIVFRPPAPGASPGTDAGNVFNERYATPRFDFALANPQTYDEQIEEAYEWLRKFDGNIVLGVGGPRESEYPGMYNIAFNLIKTLLSKFKTQG